VTVPTATPTISPAYRMARDPDVMLTDVQWVLGHAHLSTTQRYLTISLTEDVIEGMLAFHARRRDGVRPHHSRTYLRTGTGCPAPAPTR
jgi:hypothetical protein